MTIWGDQWWIAFIQKVIFTDDTDATPFNSVRIYWYVGGPYKSSESAQAALNELAAFVSSDYIVLPSEQLRDIVMPEPRSLMDRYFIVPERWRARDFPAEYLPSWYNPKDSPRQLERPGLMVPKKMRDF